MQTPSITTSPVEFRVGRQSSPYLADHGFHDLVVLPGSFYIELVRRAHRELFHREALVLRDITFENPVILTEDDVTLTVRIETQENGRVSYDVFEAAREAVESSSAPQRSARLLVEPEPVSLSADLAVRFDPDATPGQTAPEGQAREFYRQQRRNGNQYGPHFQTLAGAWPVAGKMIGRFADTAAGGELGPTLLDAGAQLLSALAIDDGRTFILKSIDRVLVAAAAGNGVPRWLSAARTNSAGVEDLTLVGAVDFFDDTGTCLCRMSGVTLAFIDRPAAAEAVVETPVCVASTFTIEPVEESLRFWGRHFDRPVRVDFAPYNQVFQQLLDPTSAFRGNRDGFNTIVLGLEDWRTAKPHPLRPVDPARAAAAFAERPRCVLPNGLEIVHLNRYETDYVYQEIFEDQCYLRHDIQLADGDTVVDVGANIGLFSLFVLSRCQDPAIYAYEPSPRVFDLLQANLAAYGDPARVHPVNCGVAETRGRERFTFYEHSSVFSSFHPDQREDRAAVQAVVRNVLQHELSGAGGVQEADVEDLTTHRLEAQTIECPLTSVSDIIRDHGLTRIHLLKVDAEKCEMGVIQGIAEEHWPLIDQIVIEVHDRTGATGRDIEDLLSGRGFRCAMVEEKLLESSGLFNIYATRRASAAPSPTDADEEFSRKVGEFCDALDTFAAAASTPLVLAVAPRLPGGEKAELDTAEARILARTARHPQVRFVSSQAILESYPVRELFDAHSLQLGHMPFTQEGYAAIGTALSRAMFHFEAPPIKVIALDCDNTLWKGVCGEDGAEEVVVAEPFRRLQEFMVAQARAGVLIALCSKNNEQDALAVFERNSGMVLRREHLAGWQINWEAKPGNLRALAARFDLGLGSFLFIDDNPLECAAVRDGCPEVTVLQLPSDEERIPAFLESLWIFDHGTETREDQERSQWYRANAQRDELRIATPTLRDFLDSLQLRVEVTTATADQLGRVAQLTARTNQFNLTSIRRSEAEIRELLKSGATCLVASVSDRFGDYGLVGVILYTAGTDDFTVDTLLLSCRALGKGVEHRMIAELAQRALRDGKLRLKLSCHRTERNEPARDFCEKLGAATPAGSDFTLDLSASHLAELRYAPNEQAAPAKKDSRSDRSGNAGRTNYSAAMQRLGDEFTSIDAIVAAVQGAGQQGHPTVPAAELGALDGASALEHSLAAIWKKVLGRTHLGYDERFFDAGGTSLKAVVVVATIRKELKKDLSIVSLFECPTIKLLAARLDDSATAKTESSAATGAESRGRQRRNKFMNRGSR